MSSVFDGSSKKISTFVLIRCFKIDLPSPTPVAAPFMRPGRSQIIYFLSRFSMTPRFGDTVVKGYESVLAFEFVIFLISVLLPELGNPKIAISVIKLNSSFISFLDLF